jgi:SAM-dependent methyltransferase
MASAIERTLGVASLYDLFQRVVGAPASKRQFVTRHVRPAASDHVLDLGCGTGAMLELLPDGVSYVGVEIDPNYVARARERFGARGEFVCTDLTSYDGERVFEIVVAHGVMHHLDDDAMAAAGGVARRALVDGGRVVFAEPCRLPSQGRIETALMNRDRGRYIRTPERYVELLSESFPSVSTHYMLGSYRIPYSMMILEAHR